MKFIGNEKVINFLAKSIKNGAVNHAYIFSGPQAVGKTTLANMFAQAVISSNDINLDVEYEDKDAMFDLITIEPEIVEKKGIIKKKDISIESIRAVQQSLSLFPYQGKYKVLIIKDAHRMNNAAQNGLLKLLEEPNPTSILILVTHEIDRILPTVQSRCEKVNFSLVSEDEIREEFSSQKKYDADIPYLSMGRPGMASLMLENTEELELRRDAKKQLSSLRSGSLNEKLQLAEEFSKNISRTLDIFNIWIWFLRIDALSSNDPNIRNNIFGIIEKIQMSMTYLKNTNANSRLLLETLFMDI